MDKRYKPKQIESKLYEEWEESGYFNPDNLEGEETFSVPMAPVNITGRLHMGHALENTLMDVLVRRKRMQGYKTLWYPGTDHAGIATEVKVEKKLLDEGQDRQDLERDEFIKKVWDWKKKYGDIITDQFKKMGISCDWSRERFTMDDDYEEAVKTAFQHYQNKDWVYKGDRLVNWCPHCQTALSGLEVEHEEKKGKLWFINYPLKDSDKSVTIATTRPETMLGDTAIAVSPDDERYEDLIGKTAILPLVGRELPIIKDHRIDPEFGTGALKVTPAHDETDWEIGREHDLEVVNVINKDGEMNDNADDYEGLTTKEAREKIVEELDQQDYLEKTEDYQVQKGICYRCSTTIEPLTSQQWFVEMDALADKAKEAVKSGEVELIPEKWEGPYLDWLDNLHDWCISRQIWWGHQIPVEGEEDVLDTWFSSALWPFAALGWPQECKDLEDGTCEQPQGDLEQFYPADVVTSAKGILYLWQVRMVFSGMEFMEEPPFEKIFIHPMVLTEDGKRMSKSLGTGVDPLDLIEEYGADATRFGLAWQTTGVQAIKFSEDALKTGEKFANKVWNATRFIKMNLDEEFTTEELYDLNQEDLTEADKTILNQLEEFKEQFDQDLDDFRFGQAARSLYHFFWDDYCDVYLETAKEQEDGETQKVLLRVLSESLKMLHPFMPYLTEEIYDKLPLKDKEDFLMIEDWPN
ncbi:MAG: valine--tRNA ligase [Candidatus Paceibacterota bacterium]